MSDAHLSMDVGRAGIELRSLLERVCQSWGRVEISNAGERCVLISKDELDSMERALEILCAMPGGDEICKNVSRLGEHCVEQFSESPPNVRFPVPDSALQISAQTPIDA